MLVLMLRTIQIDRGSLAPLVFFTTLALAAALALGTDVTFYVSKNGNDSANSGRSCDQSFLTLERAIAASMVSNEFVSPMLPPSISFCDSHLSLYFPSVTMVLNSSISIRGSPAGTMVMCDNLAVPFFDMFSLSFAAPAWFNVSGLRFSGSCARTFQSFINVPSVAVSYSSIVLDHVEFSDIAGFASSLLINGFHDLSPEALRMSSFGSSTLMVSSSILRNITMAVSQIPPGAIVYGGITSTQTTVVFQNVTVNTIRLEPIFNETVSCAGGVLSSSSSNVLYQSCVVANVMIACSGNVTGGAFLHYGEENVTVEDSSFTTVVSMSQFAVVYGGVMHSDGSVAVSRSTFAHNLANGSLTATSKGGCLMVRSSAWIRNTSFVSNGVFPGSGGALWVSLQMGLETPLNGIVILDNVTAVSNSATAEGGFARVHAANLLIRSCQFVSNVIVSTSNGSHVMGGALAIFPESVPLYVIKASFLRVEVNASSFVNNSVTVSSMRSTDSARGGAVFVGIAARFSDCDLESNRAMSTAGQAAGGAIYVDPFQISAAIAFVRTSAVANLVYASGAFGAGGGFLYGMATSVVDSVFQGNRAVTENVLNSYGGALALVTSVVFSSSIPTLRDVKLTNCSFIGNVASAAFSFWPQGLVRGAGEVCRERGACGGAIGAAGMADVVITASSFIQNKVYVQSVENVPVTVTAEGGAVYSSSGVYDMFSLTASDTKFAGNAATAGQNVGVHGGAVRIYNYYNYYQPSVANVSLLNSFFFQNFGNASGGVCNGGAVSADASLLVLGSVFLNSSCSVSADHGCEGGAVHVTRSSALIRRCDISLSSFVFSGLYSNTSSAYAQGGAVSCADGVILANTMFESSSIVASWAPTVNGGALHTAGRLQAVNCSFFNSFIHGRRFASGGAVHSTDYVTFENSLFLKNTGVSEYAQGGAVYGEKGFGITNCSFQGNMVMGSMSAAGGAMRVSTTFNGGLACFVNRSTFEENVAVLSTSLTSGTATGGAVTLEYPPNSRVTGSTSVRFVDCSFFHNSARSFSANQCYGGAIYAPARESVQSAFAFLGSIFVGNWAVSETSVSGGGAVALFIYPLPDAVDGHEAVLWNWRTVLVSDCYFYNNAVTGARAIGGALAVAKSSLEMHNSTFEENLAIATDASSSGGALFVMGWGLMSRLSFTHNCAMGPLLSSGGAVHHSDPSGMTEIAILDSFYANNTAGGQRNVSERALGGAIHAECQKLRINATFLQANSAFGSEASGGALHIFHDNNVVVYDDVVCINNTVVAGPGTASGGCISSTGQIFLQNSLFDENSVAASSFAFGGAVSSSSNVIGKVSKCEFSGNSVRSTVTTFSPIPGFNPQFYGGALFAAFGVVQIANTTFQDNSVIGIGDCAGGAVFVGKGVVGGAIMATIFRKNFVSTTSKHGSASGGAVMYWPALPLQLADNAFHDSFIFSDGVWVSCSGGALASAYGLFSVANTFWNNSIRCVGTISGGAIATTATAVMISCTFINNSISLTTALQPDSQPQALGSALCVGPIDSIATPNPSLIDLTIENCILEQHTIVGRFILVRGGVVSFTGNQLDARNSSISDFSILQPEVLTGGGLFVSSLGDVNLSNMKFSNGVVQLTGHELKGGGVYVLSPITHRSFTITYVLVHCIQVTVEPQGNTLSISGVGVWLSRMVANMISCQFSANALTISSSYVFDGSVVDGAGLTVDAAMEMHIVDSIFVNNSLQYGHGGAVSVRSVTAGMSLANVSCTGNMATWGACVATSSVAVPLLLSASRFSDNRAFDSGGALFSDSPSMDLFVDNCSFLHNSAFSGSGGAICLASVQRSRVQLSEFVLNYAAHGGGSISATCNADCWMQFEDCIFMNNSVVHCGSSSDITDSGGDLSISGSNARSSSVDILRSLFTDSWSSCPGGALWMKDVHLSVLGSNFSRITAGGMSSGAGGAVSTLGSFSSSSAHIAGCLFLNCVIFSGNGGALGFADGLRAVNVHDNVFVNCRAPVGGGGSVYIADMDPSSVFNNKFFTDDVIHSALYGPEVAGAAVALHVVQSPLSVASGHGFPLDSVTIVDSMNQVIVSSAVRIAVLQVRTNDSDNSYITGPGGLARDDVGRFQFDGSNLFGTPGAVLTLKLNVLNFRTAPLQRDVVVRIASCQMGEQEADHQCVPCSPGSYSLSVGSACSPCPPQALCSGGSAVLATKGFWKYIAPSTTTPVLYACPYGFCAGDDQCGDLRDPTSPLCGRCVLGASLWSHKCVACVGPNGGLLLVFLLSCFCMVLLLYCSSRAASPPAMTKVFFFFVQTASLIIRRPLHSYSSLLEVFEFGGETFGLCLFPRTDIEALQWRVSFPVILLAILGIACIVHGGIRHMLSGKHGLTARNAFRTVPWSRYAATACLVIIFSFQSAAEVGLQYFRCDYIGDRTVVTFNPGIWCDSSEYMRSAPLFGLLIAICVLLPIVVLGLVLWSTSAKSPIAHATAISMSTRRKMVSVLYNTYNDRARWWEAVVMVRRLAIVSTAVIFSSQDLLMYQPIALSIVLAAMALLHALVQPFRRPVDNRMELCSLLALTILCSIASALESQLLRDSTMLLIEDVTDSLRSHYYDLLNEYVSPPPYLV
jgi:hypothetical protein